MQDWNKSNFQVARLGSMIMVKTLDLVCSQKSSQRTSLTVMPASSAITAFETTSSHTKDTQFSAVMTLVFRFT